MNTTLNQVNETLETVKDQMYIILLLLAIWLLNKMKKLFQFCYHKYCPSDVSKILDEPNDDIMNNASSIIL